MIKMNVVRKDIARIKRVLQWIEKRKYLKVVFESKEGNLFLKWVIKSYLLIVSKRWT